VTATRAALAQAIKRSAFKRSLKDNIRIPADLPDLVERLLARAPLDALAMANKAGRVVAGFERVESAITSGGLAALIHAAEASPDGVRKLAAAQARRGNAPSPARFAGDLSPTGRGEEPHGRAATSLLPCGERSAPEAPAEGDHPHGREIIPLVRVFTASQLGLALGRPNVIHAALLGGRESDSFLARWRTLERYRANDGDEPTRAGTETVQPHAASELGTE
jgi:ribosomal protein L7Ae-like RNA K-turn-binding protein